MESTIQQQDFSERYAHLLKPMKDLAQNWNIDLASKLEEFVVELDTMQFSVSDRGGLTFAQAAMLIEGSTWVYGRKVEYLYRLVYDALETLNRRNQKARAAPTDGDGEEGASNDDSGTAVRGRGRGRRGGQQQKNPFDADEFDELENLAPAKFTSIRLKRDTQQTQALKCILEAKRLPLLPMSLIPLEDFEKSDIPLLGRDGEPIGKKDDFRLNSCTIHSSGALLLDVANAALIRLDNRLTAAATQPPVEAVDDYDDAPVDDDDYGCGSGDENMPDAGPVSDGTNAFSIAPLEHARGPSDGTCGIVEDASRGSVTVLKAGDKCATHLRSGRTGVTSISSALPPVKEEVDLANETDPWEEELDLYSVAENNHKPLKVGRPYGSKDQLEKTLKRRFKKELKQRQIGESEAATMLAQVASVWLVRELFDPLDKLANTAFFSRRQLLPAKLSKAIGSGSTAFDDVVYNEFLRRKKCEQQWGKVDSEVRKDRRYTDRQTTEGDDYVEDDDGYGDDAGDSRAASPVIDGDDICVTTSAELVEAEMAERSSPPLTYEEKVRRYLDEQHRSAGAQLALSDLAKRVLLWEQKLLPLLQEEERRRKFDVQQYCSDILNMYGEGAGQVLPFSKMVVGQPAWETARYFLSSLMMANTMNLEVMTPFHGQPCETLVNSMQLKLLTKERNRERFEEIL